MAEVSNNPERNSVGETDSLVSSSSTVIPAHDGSKRSGGELGAVKGSPIDRLPHELFVAVFDLYVGANTPVQDLVTLILVCRRWWNIVEGTPSLWRRISGREGLSALRKALAMARDVPLEIKYSDDIAEMDIKTFFAQIDGRVAQWKSLVVAAASLDSALAPLRTTAGPKLQTLHLIGRWGQEWDRGVVTLFGGEPAAQALKHIRLANVQIVVAPLRLSGLRSLILDRSPIISAEELLRVLRESLALEELALYSLDCLKDFVVPGPGAHSSLTGAHHPAIQLSHLRHLSLLGLPVSFIQSLLSVIRPQTLRSFSLDCEIHNSPASELFTADLSHLPPALKRSIATAEVIEITSPGDNCWALRVGNLCIRFEGPTLKPKHVEETLDWVSGHSGGHLKHLPASLFTHEFDARSDLILWLGATLKVTHLELWIGTGPGRKIISLLSHPVVANQWALPDLESIKTNVVNELGKSEILGMVKARHSFIREQEEQKCGDIRLRQFRKLRLRGGWNGVGKEQAANVKFLAALEKVGRGAEIWWGKESDLLVPSTSNAVIARGGSGKSRGELEPVVISGSSIDRLPHELFVAAFDRYIGANTPVQDLVTLILVCKLWRNIVEGTPSLWRRISGREGLSAVRKALAMARDVPLEIKYSDYIAKIDIKTFFAQIGDRIARWSSLVLEVADASLDPPLAALKTTAAPRLQTLHLSGPCDREWEGGAVTLFGGEPAAQALKDLNLDYVQVIVAPLRLSGLRALELNKMPIISAEELLRVIRDSPTLEELTLQRLVCLDGFVVPGHERGLGAHSSLTGAHHPAIQLLHLQHLSLEGLPVSFTHLLLSVIRPPNLQSFSLECEMDKSPASELLTANLSHLAPALKGSTATAEKIGIHTFGESSWMLYIGDLNIGFEGLTVKPNHVEETLDWVAGHPGGHLKDLPASLVTHELDASSDLILWLGATLKVTYLELWTGSWSGHGERTQPRKIISLLSHPLAANQWALPALESIKTNVSDELGKSEILEMVKARHSFIREQEEQKCGDIRLRQFKELRLWGGRNGVGKEQAANVEFLTALEKVGRGAAIWWEKERWTGSENESSTDVF